MDRPQPTGFVHGLFAGFGATMVVVQALLAVVIAPMAETFDQLGIAAVPALSRLVTSHAWLIGAPIAGAALVIALIVARPKRLGPYIASALLLVAIAVASTLAAYAPIWKLAGDVKADDTAGHLEPLDALPR